MADENPNGFEQYKLMFLDRFKRNDERLESIEQKLDRLRGDVLTLKVKSGLWGGISGAVVTALGGIIIALIK